MNHSFPIQLVSLSLMQIEAITFHVLSELDLKPKHNPHDEKKSTRKLENVGNAGHPNIGSRLSFSNPFPMVTIRYIEA